MFQEGGRYEKKSKGRIIVFGKNILKKKRDKKPPADMPVLVSLFNTRLKLAEASVTEQQGEVFPQALADLRAQIKRIPCESFPVKKVLHQMASAWEDAFWQLLTPAKVEFLRLNV